MNELPHNDEKSVLDPLEDGGGSTTGAAVAMGSMTALALIAGVLAMYFTENQTAEDALRPQKKSPPTVMDKLRDRYAKIFPEKE